jgi:hypothetical protein
MVFHRSYGATRDCFGCRYWSEMIAQSIGGGPIEALCLCATSPHRSKYVTANQTCDAWASGHLGAVDDPVEDGDESNYELYKQEGA